MKIAIRHAWLQKHPSPAAGRGEFHWYPAEGDRELRASLVERSRGVDAPAVLWQLAPGRVSWARVFAATAPVDGRRYVGMALAIAEAAGASPAELLEALAVPAAAPWGVEAEGGRGEVEVEAERGSAEGERGSAEGERGDAEGERGAAAESAGRRIARARRWWGSAAGRDRAVAEVAPQRARAGGADLSGAAGGAEIAGIARALMSGGEAVMVEPDCAALPALIASVERWLPEDVTGQSRAGAWRAGAAPPSSDRVAGMIAAAWAAPASRAAQAWAVLCELAASQGRSVDEIAGAIGAAGGPAVTLTEAECAVIGGERGAGRLVATLHAWGRGRLDASADAATLPARLADAVAMRALACLAGGGDPARPIAEARWHALLPAARRAALLDAVVQRAGSLRGVVEGARAVARSAGGARWRS